MRKLLITWSKQVEVVLVTRVGKEVGTRYPLAAKKFKYVRFSLSSVSVSMLKSPKSVQPCFTVFKKSSKEPNDSRKTVNFTPSGQ